MRVNPFVDAFKFLFHGGWTMVVFWVLMVASIVLAVLNFRRDPKQRSAVDVWNWLARFFIGTMWWQQSLWKIPPTYTDQPDGSGGLRYWMGEMVKNSAFPVQGDFVKNVVLPHFQLFAPQVYFGEVLIAISLILGLFSRLGGLLGTLLAINLWLGLYRAPSEWPWTYFFLAVIQIMFLVYAPGRSLGVDALLINRERAGTVTSPWWKRLL